MLTASDLIKKEFVSVDIGSSFSSLAGLLVKSNEKGAVVLENGKYRGIVDRHAFSLKRINLTKTKIRNIIKHRSKESVQFFVPSLKEDTGIDEIARLMASANSHILPVLRKEEVVGIVEAIDVAKHIADERPCSELASLRVITANKNDKIAKLLTIFSVAGIDHIPIVDDGEELVGMVATSDVLSKHIFLASNGQHIQKQLGYDSGERKSIVNLPISNIMTNRICTISPKSSLSEAVRLMEAHKISSLVLSENKRVAGILTLKDILQMDRNIKPVHQKVLKKKNTRQQ